VKRYLTELVLFAWLAAACGGGKPPAASADGEGDRDDARGGERASEDESEEESAPAPPSCDDGTCFRCGAGICPKGFYCDEDASGGAACGWLPSCAEEATCTCVKQTLGASCRCEEQGGGVSVDCD
jgi:hypothetical protein